MEQAKGRMRQTEFTQLDRLYALIPKKPINPTIKRTFAVGIIKGKGRSKRVIIVKAEVDTSFCSQQQRRIILTENDIACLTVRFIVVDGLWNAVTAVAWTAFQSFASPEQFASQYLAYRQTGKKQFGINQQQSLPLFEAIA